MKNFYTFINENKHDIDSLFSIIVSTLKELKTIDCDINITYPCGPINGINVTKMSGNGDDVMVYLTDMSFPQYLSNLIIYNEQIPIKIYDYLRDKYKDDERVGYLFTGKDLGLLWKTFTHL